MEIIDLLTSYDFDVMFVKNYNVAVQKALTWEPHFIIVFQNFFKNDYIFKQSHDFAFDILNKMSIFRPFIVSANVVQNRRLEVLCIEKGIDECLTLPILYSEFNFVMRKANMSISKQIDKLNKDNK